MSGRAYIFVVAAIVLLAASSRAQAQESRPAPPPNALTDQERAGGWTLLWDGTTTAGWRGARLDQFPERGWEMADGALTVLAADGGEATNGGDIVTTKLYAEFELSLEFRLSPGANSGVKYFVVDGLKQGPGSSIGLEYQLLDDAVHPDARLGTDGNRTLGSLYDLIPALATKPVRPIGEWNEARIVARGNHVEHWLNGAMVVEYDRGTQMFRALVAHSKYAVYPRFGEAPIGRILLQDHGARVSFRNIKIRDLRDSPIDPWREIARLDQARSRVAAARIEEEILHVDSRGSYGLEQKLLAVLADSECTADARGFVCRMLRLIGSDACIQPLRPLLENDATSDLARYALEALESTAIDTVFRVALPKLTGRAKAGLIGSIGFRRDRKALPALKALITDQDTVVAEAARAAVRAIER